MCAKKFLINKVPIVFNYIDIFSSKLKPTKAYLLINGASITYFCLFKSMFSEFIWFQKTQQGFVWKHNQTLSHNQCSLFRNNLLLINIFFSFRMIAILHYHLIIVRNVQVRLCQFLFKLKLSCAFFFLEEDAISYW